MVTTGAGKPVVYRSAQRGSVCAWDGCAFGDCAGGADRFRCNVGGNGYVNVMVPTAAASCGSGADGTVSAPVQVAATGWWSGLLCGYGHASYLSADVKPGRTFTVEVTALDEQGLATTTKAMPVIACMRRRMVRVMHLRWAWLPRRFKGSAQA